MVSTGMECGGDHDHVKLTNWWALTLAAFLVGLPLCVLLPPRLILRLGKDPAMHELLFRKYERGKARYEAATMGLKAATVVAMTLFSALPLLQSLAALALQCGALALLRRDRPFRTRRDGETDAVLLWCTIAQLLVGLVAYAGAPEALVSATFLLAWLVQGERIWRLARREPEGGAAGPSPRAVGVAVAHDDDDGGGGDEPRPGGGGGGKACGVVVAPPADDGGGGAPVKVA